MRQIVVQCSVAYKLGRVYLDLKRYAEAQRMFEIGVSENDAPSMNMLGRMYKNGIGVNRDITRARSLLEKSVSLGNLFAKRSLAEILLRGNFGPLQFLRGIYLWISGFMEVATVAFADSRSDRLR